MIISSHPNDIIIGEVNYHCQGNIYNIKVSHIRTSNKASYNDRENIEIKDIDTATIIGKTITCTIKYRDVYNILLCNVKLNLK